MVAFVRNCLVKMTLKQFQPLTVVITIVPTLLRQLRRSLQAKEIIANTPRVHSHEKRKCSLETQTTLLIFSLELETSGLAVQSVHQNRKSGGFCEELLNEFAYLVTLKMFQPLPVMTMLSTLLKQFKASLQNKKSLANAPRVLQFPEQPKHTCQSITVKKGWLLQDISDVMKKAAEVAKKKEQ